MSKRIFVALIIIENKALDCMWLRKGGIARISADYGLDVVVLVVYVKVNSYVIVTAHLPPSVVTQKEMAAHTHEVKIEYVWRVIIHEIALVGKKT